MELSGHGAVLCNLVISKIKLELARHTGGSLLSSPSKIYGMFCFLTRKHVAEPTSRPSMSSKIENVDAVRLGLTNTSSFRQVGQGNVRRAHYHTYTLHYTAPAQLKYNISLRGPRGAAAWRGIPFCVIVRERESVTRGISRPCRLILSTIVQRTLIYFCRK